MAIEIEKKYRLKTGERERLLARLSQTGAVREGVEFEENTIYTGGNLDPKRAVLRVRRVEGKVLLTYKERYTSASAIKHQREEETRVEDAEALAAILDALGFAPALVYEKRRETWALAGAMVVVDELPFGLFAEIEGEEEAIKEAERLLELEDAEAEMETYPHLTERYGKREGTAIEARFES
ncbi:MAG: class IV adenylate cyclase [Pyrinomonadaceae bacterium]|nr:class IV adenylate cyclase [Pyrinomonadaceae bacterium]